MPLVRLGDRVDLCAEQPSAYVDVDWFRDILQHTEPERGPRVSDDWSETLPDILREWAVAFRTTWNTVSRLEAIERNLITLRHRISALENSRPTAVPINSFAPEPYEMTKPIHVVVRPVESDFVASFVDANLSASGETIFEAVENLKDVILGTFEVLANQEDRKLGKMPQRQLSVIRSFIRKI